MSPRGPTWNLLFLYQLLNSSQCHPLMISPSEKAMPKLIDLKINKGKDLSKSKLEEERNGELPRPVS